MKTTYTGQYYFGKMNLSDAEDKFLEHQNFNKWFEKMKEIFPNNFNEKAVTVLLQYRSEDDLYTILDAGKIGSTADVTEDL